MTDPHLLRTLEPRTAQWCGKALTQLPLLASFDARPVFRRAPPLEGRKRREPNVLEVGLVVPHKRIENGADILSVLNSVKSPRR